MQEATNPCEFTFFSRSSSSCNAHVIQTVITRITMQSIQNLRNCLPPRKCKRGILARGRKPVVNVRIEATVSMDFLRTKSEANYVSRMCHASMPSVACIELRRWRDIQKQVPQGSLQSIEGKVQKVKRDYKTELREKELMARSSPTANPMAVLATYW